MPTSVYASSIRASLSQGDILGGVSIEEKHLGQKAQAYPVMALSHGCEIDKPHNRVLLVARVRVLTDFGRDDHEGIREGRLLSLFYLPPSSLAAPERCVDFRQIFRVSFEVIRATDWTTLTDDRSPQRTFSGGDPRTDSLSEFGVAALQGRIVAFFTRSRAFEPTEE